jgi:hypothetical protein
MIEITAAVSRPLRSKLPQPRKKVHPRPPTRKLLTTFKTQHQHNIHSQRQRRHCHASHRKSSYAIQPLPHRVSAVIDPTTSTSLEDKQVQSGPDATDWI